MAGCSVERAIGALEIPVSTYHRSISGNEGSLLLNQSIREPGLKSSQCCGNSWSSQPSRPAPKPYKQAIQVWIGVAGLSLMLAPCGDSPGLLARVSPLPDQHGDHRGSAHLFGNAIAKQGKWILLAEAAEAGITLSSYPATPQLSQCPEIGRLPGILLGMVVSKPIPLHL